MYYYYPTAMPYHWDDIMQMIEENYAGEYAPNDLLLMAVHHHHSIEKLKSENPGHGKVIVYQLEPLNKSHWWNEDHIIERLKDADEVWDYDLDNIKKLKKHGIDAKFKPFLYSERLKRIENKPEPDIDILFYGTLTDYRYKFLERINHYGSVGTTVCAFGLSREVLDEFIGRSKIIIDLQLSDSETFIQKQTRLYYALINNKCVLSEKSHKNYYGDLIVEVNNDVDEILKTAEYLISSEKWREYSNISDKFKNLTLYNMIDNAFSNVESQDKIAIFYHLYQVNDWKKLYQEQINSLIVSGLYEKCDFIQIGVNGDQELPFVLDKIIVSYNENKILEANTLNYLWDFCNENPDHKVMYFHSKGLTHFHSEDCSVTTNAWRIYLEYFVIHHWEKCVEDLNQYDCVGSEWINDSLLWDSDLQQYVQDINPHYAGNFWWANASYIQKLDINVIYNDKKGWGRWQSEFWVGTKSPNYKSYHNSNEFLYNFNYSPNFYMNSIESEKNQLMDEPSMKNRVFIITPCTRPLNLSKISGSIPKECEWIVVFDEKVKNNHDVDNAIKVKSPHTGFRGYPNKNFGLDYIQQNLNPKDSDWIVVLHDDNIIHPNWWKRIENYLNSEHSILTWGQCTSEEVPRIPPVETPMVGNIDLSQYMVRWDVAKNIRFETVYESDGIYIAEACKHGKVLMLNEYLCYYNFLRSYKAENEIRTNICMISMFKNESKGIRRMLESVWRHIDFYVFQDNGSTDGTADIVREFFADKNVPGFIYEVEEGWVSFGWNRDHLLQTTLKNDHGCDWIMKMDCDEYLEIDADFDWSYFDNKEVESFHVTAQSPGCIYYRAWIWNAKLPWKFQHDPAHEIIYLDNGRGEHFERFNLPSGFKMIGTPDGESYTVRTKYISDALKLEEKMIREESMFTDLYHFWYIGKSYQDCYQGDFYPFGNLHSEEFGKRAIFYYKEYLKYMNAQGIHEMSYFTMFAIGDIYKSLGDYESAIFYYENAEKYCPVRNEHIVCLARTYHDLGQYDKMLEQTTRLVDPNRKLPFPDFFFLIDTNVYVDSGPIPQQMHDLALSLVSQPKTITSINEFKVQYDSKPRMWIVDNFYQNPHEVRNFALNLEFEANLNYYKGNRSKKQYIIPGTKEAFEKILGFKIKNWTETHGMCGRFQYCTAEDDLVYHCDSQTWAGMVYLTPDAPYSCGTSLFAHKSTGLRNENDFNGVNVFYETGYYDRTKFELVDTAGNVFNRLVLFDAKCIHSANEYFGTTFQNSRLFHLFFFD